MCVERKKMLVSFCKHIVLSHNYFEEGTSLRFSTICKKVFLYLQILISVLFVGLRTKREFVPELGTCEILVVDDRRVKFF